MKKILIGLMAVGIATSIASAQTGTYPGESGVYVEEYDQNGGPNGQGVWSSVLPSHNRYRVDSQGDPDPMPGLSGAELDRIELNVSGNTYYSIFAIDSSNTDIGEIVISGNINEYGGVHIGRVTAGVPDMSVQNAVDFAGCNNLRKLTTSGSNVLVKAYIKGDLGVDPLTDVFMARQIANLRCNGAVNAWVVSNPSNDPTAPPMGYIECNSVSVGAVVTANNVDLHSLTVNGSLNGTVEATGGNIGSATITYLNGTLNAGGSIPFADIGTIAGGSLITGGDLAQIFVTANSWGSIHVGGDLVLAGFDGSWGVQGTTNPTYHHSSIVVGGDITDMEVGLPAQNGTFVSDVSANTVARLVIRSCMLGYDELNGVFVPANITFTESLSNLSVHGYPSFTGVDGSYFNLTTPTITGSFYNACDYVSGHTEISDGLPEGSIFELGDGLLQGASVHFALDPADPNDVGLAGTAGINIRENGHPWDGIVTVGASPSTGIVLDANYKTLSYEIGGGHMGNVGYNFHQYDLGPIPESERDCKPYQGEAYHLGQLALLDEVRIRHYGPVFIESDTLTAPYFKIEFRPSFSPGGTPAAWQDRTFDSNGAPLFEVRFYIPDDPGTPVDDSVEGTGYDRGTAFPDVFIRKVNSKDTGFKAAGQWRIRPMNDDSDKVRCYNYWETPVQYNSNHFAYDGLNPGEVSTDPNEAPHYWYSFGVWLEAPSGMLLLEGNNGPSLTDISTWIAEPFETNADGETNTQDFIDMANQYTGP